MITDPKAKEISNMMDGYQKSFVLAAAVRLSLFQKLAYLPYQVPELASNCGIKPDYMRRLLSALQCMGLVNLCKDSVELTDKGYLIVTDHNLCDYLLVSSVEWIKSWSFLFETLCNQKVSDGSSWESRSQDTSLDQAFHNLMVKSTPDKPLFPLNVRFGATVVDLGGGLGANLLSVLKVRPDLKAVLFDLPHVVSAAQSLSMTTPIKEFIGGSFFEVLPSGGDLYILNNILHDWDDEHAEQILKNCFATMAVGSQLVVTETFLPESGSDEYASMMDIHLMVVHGGRKRKKSEYEALLSDCGFSINQDNYVNSIVSFK